MADSKKLTPQQEAQGKNTAKNAAKTAEKTAEKKVKSAQKPEKQAKEAPKKEKHKKMRTYQQRQDRNGYAFMAPWIIGFAIFTLFPFVMTIYLSFNAVQSTAWGYQFDFIGIDNYINAFVGNEEFLPALLGYLKMIVPYTIIVVVLAFIIAYLLCKINVGKGILRTIYFLPVIIMSGPVMSQLLTVQGAGDEISAEMNAAVETTNAYFRPVIRNSLVYRYSDCTVYQRSAENQSEHI